MDTLQGMKVFVRVAQRSSFAAAGRDLRMSPASVTKYVAALETRVGARLFDRTTRNVGLTEAGRLYLERCLECLQAFEEADASIGELARQPTGTLRVTAPVDLGGDIASVAARLATTHPNLTVDLQLSNRPVDLVEEGIDVAIRVAPSLDGRFVARQIARTRMAAFAAPSYLGKHGHPRHPRDLEQHRALVFLEPRPRDEWVFERAANQVRIKLKAVMTSNGGGPLANAAAAGAGVFVAPSFVCRPDLATGRIVHILPDWTILPDLNVYAVYPHRRFLAPKVRAFIETLRAEYGDGTSDPWWSEPPVRKTQRLRMVRPQRRTSRTRQTP